MPNVIGLYFTPAKNGPSVHLGNSASGNECPSDPTQYRDPPNTHLYLSVDSIECGCCDTTPFASTGGIQGWYGGRNYLVVLRGEWLISSLFT